MLIPRYWSKAETHAAKPSGETLPLACWRWSDVSLADAQKLAREAVERIAVRVRRGDPFPARYAYGSRPLREEVVRDIDDGDGERVAAITRNSYGALVLNTARVLFIDVDLKETSPAGSLWTWIARLFGCPSSTTADAGGREAAIAKVQQWTDTHHSWGFRVYRTRAGLRYLVTHALFAPGGTDSEAAMQALDCDPAYLKLCRAQQSFRARLTPKPWRCGIALPPTRFPGESEREERAIRAWEANYAKASDGYATCKLVGTFGSTRMHPAVEPIVTLHDEHTRAQEDLPLA
jgi:hypothetical protein